MLEIGFSENAKEIPTHDWLISCAAGSRIIRALLQPRSQ